MRTEGFMVRVGTSESRPETLPRLISAAVRASLPGSWVLTSVSADGRDYWVHRRQSARNPTVARAFEYARILKLHRDVADCEPALEQPVDGLPGLQPDPVRRRRVGRAPEEGLAGPASSESSSSHLVCSTELDWALEMCRIRAAWEVPPPAGGKSRGEDIVIAHPDTGYTLHPHGVETPRLLIGQGYDFEDDDADPVDPLSGRSGGHGTSTSSVIAGRESGEVAGAAPRARVIPLRVTDNVVLLSFAKLIAAIRHATAAGAGVMSISLGGPVSSRFLGRAVREAALQGTIIVSAAGNHWPFVVYPARLDEVVAVAACNCRRQVWAGSASGDDVDVTAPGESVWRALASGSGFLVERSSGTSYATALVAGAAALWLAHHGRAKLIHRFGAAGVPRVFKELLIRHGVDTPAGWDTRKLGAGILNAEKLLRAPLPVTVMAGGFQVLRTTPRPEPLNHVDRLLRLFPGSQSDDVIAGLSKLLRVRSSRLNSQLSEVADEVEWHAATNLEFRRRICGTTLRRPSRTRFRSSSAVTAFGTQAVPPEHNLMPELSRQLAEMMGGH
jgi:thermitase